VKQGEESRVDIGKEEEGESGRRKGKGGEKKATYPGFAGGAVVWWSGCGHDIGWTGVADAISNSETAWFDSLIGMLQC
jgi:hypothetical protein